MHNDYLTTTVGVLLVATLLSLGAILIRSVEAGEIGEATIVNLRASVPQWKRRPNAASVGYDGSKIDALAKRSRW
jgi:hypothetical protein